MTQEVVTCAECGTQHAPQLLSCPACHALVHRERLEALHAQAQRHAEEGDGDAHRVCLEQMRDLLPEGSRQRARIGDQLRALGAPKPSKIKGKLAGLGALGLLLWKFKAAILFVLSKGKLLLLGLTKGKTLLTALASMLVYWTVWGWQFALGFVLSIYVHEMGHVAALRRLGIAASAPMFVPMLGAFVRLKEYPRTAAEDARVGVAGPIYGAVAALVCYAAYLATDWSLLGALARAGAWINLFNLLPLWQLDGSRCFHALARRERWIGAALLLLAFLWTGDGLLILLALAAGYRAWRTEAPKESNAYAALSYGGLVIVLGLLAGIELPELSQVARPGGAG